MTEPTFMVPDVMRLGALPACPGHFPMRRGRDLNNHGRIAHGNRAGYKAPSLHGWLPQRFTGGRPVGM
jgi:hypothetical protein